MKGPANETALPIRSASLTARIRCGSPRQARLGPGAAPGQVRRRRDDGAVGVDGEPRDVEVLEGPQLGQQNAAVGNVKARRCRFLAGIVQCGAQAMPGTQLRCGALAVSASR